VTWSNIPDPSKDAWFGLFRIEDLGSDSTVSNRSFGETNWYVSCLTTAVAPKASGSCSFTLDPSSHVDRPAKSGTYEFRLFSDQTNNTLLAKSGPIALRSSD
jgi:hypothetical protein